MGFGEKRVTYYYIHKDEKAAIEIFQAECDRLGPDPTGEVRSGKIILKGMIEPLKSLSPRNRGAGVKLIISPFEEVLEDRSGYTIAFDNERCEEIDVHIYRDKRESTYEGLYLLKVSGNEWDVRFLVLSNADEFPTDRFSRIRIGNWHRFS